MLLVALLCVNKIIKEIFVHGHIVASIHVTWFALHFHCAPLAQCIRLRRSPQAVRKPEGPAMHCHLHRGDWNFHLTNEKKKNIVASVMVTVRRTLWHLLWLQSDEQGPERDGEGVGSFCPLRPSSKVSVMRSEGPGIISLPGPE